MSTARFWVAFVLLAATCAPALAQDDSAQISSASRAALLAAERDAKATETVPPQRSRIERALYGYDNGAGTPFIFQPWHGFQLAGGSFPAGAGTTFGVRFMHDLGPNRPAADPNRANRVEVETLAAYSTRGYARGSAGLNIYHLGGAPLDVRVRAQRYEYPQEDFFGLGQDSLEENRTNYLLRSSEANAEVQWKPARLLDIGGGFAYMTPQVGTGTDSRYPTTDQVFNPALIPGYEQQPDFLRSDASIAIDWRDNPLHPHAGGRYGVKFSDYRDRDLDSFDFRCFAIDLQQYVPIPDRYRTIALHAAAVLTDPRAGQQVPFYFQPTLGGAQALRGFREFRFQDANSLLLTAEYRWEAWWALDGAFFVDAGKVAAERRDLNLRDLDVSYGVGFRFHSNSAFVARLDLAFSREGFIPLLRFEHAF
jgi:surface antigen Omp85-like protein